MKKYSVLLFSLLIVFALAACQEQGTTTGQGAANQPTPAGNNQGQSAVKGNEQSAAVSTQKIDAKMTIDAASQQAQKAEVDRLLALQDQLNKIVAEGKIDKCSEIKDTTYNESCQVYILVKQAKSKTDTAVCDKAATDKIKELCKTYVAQR